jgi:Fe-S cluster biogenesis protein NfuA
VKNNLVVNMREKILKVIDESIRPGLQMDGGDIEFVDIDDEGVVKVRLKGACGGCPMSQMTLTMGVERILKEKIPEVKSVVAVS